MNWLIDNTPWVAPTLVFVAVYAASLAMLWRHTKTVSVAERFTHAPSHLRVD